VAAPRHFATDGAALPGRSVDRLLPMESMPVPLLVRAPPTAALPFHDARRSEVLMPESKLSVATASATRHRRKTKGGSVSAIRRLTAPTSRTHPAPRAIPPSWAQAPSRSRARIRIPATIPRASAVQVTSLQCARTAPPTTKGTGSAAGPVSQTPIVAIRASPAATRPAMPGHAAGSAVTEANTDSSTRRHPKGEKPNFAASPN
jgi:hypothetical protein